MTVDRAWSFYRHVTPAACIFLRFRTMIARLRHIILNFRYAWVRIWIVGVRSRWKNPFPKPRLHHLCVYTYSRNAIVYTRCSYKSILGESPVFPTNTYQHNTWRRRPAVNYFCFFRPFNWSWTCYFCASELFSQCYLAKHVAVDGGFWYSLCFDYEGDLQQSDNENHMTMRCLLPRQTSNMHVGNGLNRHSRQIVPLLGCCAILSPFVPLYTV